MCQILWPNVLISCLMVYSFLIKSFTVVFNSLLWVTIEAFHNFLDCAKPEREREKTLTDTYISFCSHCICVSYFVYDQCDSSLFRLFFCISRFVLYLWLCPLSNVISIALCSFFLNLFLDIFFCYCLSLALYLSPSVFALCFTAALTLFAVM